jgi:hypothetical protein
VPFPVAVWSKAEFCGCLIGGISGSNPVECMEVRLLCVVWIAASATS